MKTFEIYKDGILWTRFQTMSKMKPDKALKVWKAVNMIDDSENYTCKEEK